MDEEGAPNGVEAPLRGYICPYFTWHVGVNSPVNLAAFRATSTIWVCELGMVLGSKELLHTCYVALHSSLVNPEVELLTFWLRPVVVANCKCAQIHEPALK